jgi:hypothetical protein
MKHKTWVLCAICDRKFLAEENGNPKKHYVAPRYVKLGDIQYLTSPGWAGDQRDVCIGSNEKGIPL